jgi:hypothetical protein
MYYPNGAMAPAHQHRSSWLGVQEGDHGPVVVPRKRQVCRGKGLGSAIRTPWRQRCGRLAPSVDAPANRDEGHRDAGDRRVDLLRGPDDADSMRR